MLSILNSLLTGCRPGIDGVGSPSMPTNLVNLQKAVTTVKTDLGDGKVDNKATSSSWTRTWTPSSIPRRTGPT